MIYVTEDSSYAFSPSFCYFPSLKPNTVAHIYASLCSSSLIISVKKGKGGVIRVETCQGIGSIKLLKTAVL
jgi:hypothetical protein